MTEQKTPLVTAAKQLAAAAVQPRWSRRLRDGGKVALGMASTVGVGGALTMGCLDRPIDLVNPRTTSTNVQRLTQSSVDKIDVLLVIDNSGSMADKQQILSAAVPKLVQRLVTPQCVDPDGAPAVPAVNIDADGKCPDQFKPEFEPVRDINIGIISSSIGSAGGPLCDTTGRPNNQDSGHLIFRSEGGSTNNDVPTYGGLGFLAWDPDQKRPCPGQDSGGETCAGESDAGNLISTLTTMVAGVGEVGCGLEAPLEAAFRFLVDPKPWATITGPGTTEGEDTVLLDQRKAFLRPDSLVAVILLTDENDCSLRIDGIGQLAAAPAGSAMPRPRAECADDPGSECCFSCIEPIPDGSSCDASAGGCAEQGSQTNPANFYPGEAPDGELDQSTQLLRCHDQKRRFGIDFLYPTSRYVNAFSQTLINAKKLDLAIDGKNDVQNPLFTDLLDLGRAVRGPDLVFVAGIAGVPWQLIARKNEAGAPDLKAGIDTTSNLPIGGFQTYDELQASGTWAKMIPESPADYADDPLMIETPFPRDGLSSERDSNPINGNEWETDFGDLQYACIFDLPESAQKDCSQQGISCDCTNEEASPTGKPLCDTGTPTQQIRAKAYPGTRIFEVLNGLGGQGIPASICPAQLGLGDGQTVDDKDYGYTPAVFAIIDRLKTKLGGACQPRQLIADDEGNVPCLVIEARDSDGDRKSETDSKCNCKIDGRRDPEEGGLVAAEQIESELGNEEPSPGYDCLCEVVQLSGDARTECQNEQAPSNDVNGWCYVDATSVPPIGNKELVGNCAPSEQRLVRFVNEGEVSPGGRLYITCSGDVPSQ